MSQPKKGSLTYRVELATNRSKEESFVSSWNEFLKNGESQDKIYQTPEFFNFLIGTSDGKDKLEIFSIKKIDGGKLVGVIPVRIRKEELAFQIGAKKIASKNMHVIGLLGSVPLAPLDFDLTEQLFTTLFQNFPECHAICMSALPASSVMWDGMRQSKKILKKFHLYGVDDLRKCHTIPIFTSFDLYLQQFNTKKRYNLNRQIRLLREHYGSLSLHRIQNASEVHRLTSAINQLVPIEKRHIFLNEEKCIALAERNLLLCYVLDCGQTPGALIFGTRSNQVLHIHNILYSNALPEFSIGTSILHLVIEDLTTSFNFSSIDLGYGVPGHTYQSTNITKERAYVLIFKNTMSNRCLCWLHRCHNNAMMLAKKFIKKIKEYKIK